MAVFGIVMSTMPVVFMSHMKFNTQMEEKTGAISAAQEILDNYRVQDPSTLPVSGTAAAVIVPVNGINYRVIAHFCSDSTYCTSANNRQIKIEVILNSKTIYEIETVYTRLQ